MKKILIVGKNSYIGKSFAKYQDNAFNIDCVGAKDGEWKKVDFSGYNSILHCAAIAHVKQKNSMKQIYYGINCDMAVDCARRAKNLGVPQFIFLSSMAVYGKNETKINHKTPYNPQGFYGASKLKAEKGLADLVSDDFKISIIRPPMVYGHGCKGNFPRLVRLVKLLPTFPDVDNKRSMIYIENLCIFIGDIIKNESKGDFLPQNTEIVSTTQLVDTIAKALGKKVFKTKLFNPMIKPMIRHISTLDKLFGNLTYETAQPPCADNFINFEESIIRSVER